MRLTLTLALIIAALSGLLKDIYDPISFFGIHDESQNVYRSGYGH